MSSAYYYVQNGRQVGPVSSGGLKALADGGRLLPTDLIWKEGLSGWRRAAELKGLFPNGTDATVGPRPPAAAPLAVLVSEPAPGGEQSAAPLPQGVPVAVAASAANPPPGSVPSRMLLLTLGSVVLVILGVATCLVLRGSDRPSRDTTEVSASGQRGTAPMPTPKATGELLSGDKSPSKGNGGSRVVRAGDQPSIAHLVAEAKELKPGAIDRLAAAGPKTIPAIIEALRRDDRTYSWATAAMARMGPGAVGPVAGLLRDPDPFLRKIGYMTLGEMGPVAMPAVPLLQRAARQETDPRNRGLPENAIRQITRR